MTRQHSPKIRILSASVLFIVVLTILIAFAAPAQQAGTDQPSARSSAASEPVQASTLLPRGRNAQRVSVARSQPQRAASAASEFSFSRSDIDTGLSLWGTVLAGDFNGDGKPDLLVTVHSLTLATGIYILLGNGDGTFSPPGENLCGYFCVGVGLGDFNGDGKLDIVYANVLSGLQVVFGKGDGTFTVGPTSPAPITDVAPLVGDFNGDGKLDVALILQGGGIAVGLGNGDGTFGAFKTLPEGGSGFIGLAAADFNGDGKLDLAAVNCGTPQNDYADSTLAIFLGSGDGTFGSPTLYTVGSYSDDLVAADFNRDGKVDLAVASGMSPSVSILLGNGDGTFLPMSDFLAGHVTIHVAAADFDGDGNLDLAVTGPVTGGPNELTILPGNGDGTFGPHQDFPVASTEFDLAIADFNLDGKPDVALVDSGGSGTLTILLNTTTTGSVASTTTLTSSPNPSTFGQTVTFTAAVSSSSGTPTGTVELLYGSTLVGSGTLTDGKAQISIPTLPAGSDSVTASYLGGGNFAHSASTPLSQTVSSATTATSLVSSLNPAATSQSVTFTATVTSEYGGAATGSVTFLSGSQTLGTASLSGNRATLTTSFATAGTYSISAKYSGDANNAGSTSSPLSQVIVPATTTTLVSSRNPSLVGQAVTFTAAVSSTAGTPPNGETVTFYNGSAVLGTGALSGGIASLTTSSLPVGTFTITASYGGDTNFAASTSPGLRQVVNSTTKSATSTVLVSSLNPSIYGQRVTWTATVTTSGSVTPTGKVNFRWDGYSLGTATLNASGVATLSKSNLNVYTYPLTAVYSGDANNTGSTSPILNQVVKETTSAATLSSSPNPSTQGQAVTFTATITSPTVTATGPVTFTAGKTVLGTAQLSGHKATFTTSTLPVGATTVTATYNGDSNIAESSASFTQTVQP